MRQTVDEIIDANGGTVAFARKGGWTPSRVSNWRAFGRFPDSASVHRKITEMCEAIELEVDPTLFRPTRRDSAA